MSTETLHDVLRTAYRVAYRETKDRSRARVTSLRGGFTEADLAEWERDHPYPGDSHEVALNAQADAVREWLREQAGIERVCAAHESDGGAYVADLVERVRVAEAKVAAVETLHTGLHRCTDGWYWVEVQRRGCKSATVGLCPTRAALADDLVRIEGDEGA